MARTLITALGGLLFAAWVAGSAAAQAGVSVSTAADFYNRYVWRGMDIANTPSLQPSLSLGYGGAEVGAWGAYTLSNQTSESDEIDFYVSYTAAQKNGAAVTGLITDYYYPNAGIRFFNFNNYDALKDDSIPDPGAHTLEVGLSIAGPDRFPLTLSGYVNVYNDGGHNSYFQADFPVTVPGAALNFFVGAASGSTKNPDYYDTDDFAVINVGVTARRKVPVSNQTSLPMTVSLILNPRAEVSYLLVGLSL